jgi:hypothetical protein
MELETKQDYFFFFEVAGEVIWTWLENQMVSSVFDKDVGRWKGFIELRWLDFIYFEMPDEDI